MLAALVGVLDAPVNAILRPGGASAVVLEKAGVARLSTATSLACTTMGLIQNLAQQLRETGMFTSQTKALTHGEAHALFTREPTDLYFFLGEIGYFETGPK